MRKVILVDGGQRHLATLMGSGDKNARFGWTSDQVPEPYKSKVEQQARRGLLSLKLPLRGPNAVTWEEVEPEDAPAVEKKGKAQGVATAELARALVPKLRERSLNNDWVVICSHRGERSRKEMKDAGVWLCQIAMFLGEAHTSETRIGVADIAIAKKASPHEVAVLIEIEESKGGTKPKHVLGDALLPFVGDRIELVEEDKKKKPQPLAWDGTEIWVACHPRKGSDVARTRKLESRLNEFVRKTHDGKLGKIRLFNEPGDQLYTVLLAELEKLIGRIGAKREVKAAVATRLLRPDTPDAVADDGQSKEAP